MSILYGFKEIMSLLFTYQNNLK
uniref:Uncharacterized protein n=1 Tax=Arundo donax TaxID=35708 RepID=A0A0A9HHR8_ARUDO